MSEGDEPMPEQLHREQGRSLIERDMPCIGCGYNLRSLSLNGICTECGLPVRYSFDTNQCEGETRHVVFVFKRPLGK